MPRASHARYLSSVLGFSGVPMSMYPLIRGEETPKKDTSMLGETWNASFPFWMCLIKAHVTQSSCLCISPQMLWMRALIFIPVYLTYVLGSALGYYTAVQKAGACFLASQTHTSPQCARFVNKLKPKREEEQLMPGLPHDCHHSPDCQGRSCPSCICRAACQHQVVRTEEIKQKGSFPPSFLLSQPLSGSEQNGPCEHLRLCS